jgi:predicted kinase
MDSLSQCRVALQDAYQEIVDCKAKLADAEAERSEARSLLLNGIQTNGDSLAFLEHVRREHAAVVAERDALKATLAKHAESERAWCELATARGAELAALVKASQPFANDQGCDAVHHGLADRHDQRDTCPVVARLREALAAAKVQP